ncbi:MAG: hypothetical protein QM772_07160 [Ottowia sp.]|uniref:hypothetical protein n=1 Tax=Ottowia sp. TaxID=1898956 RepID=UPI0039E29F41
MTTATTPTLQGIALDVVARYNTAGKHLVGAWSTGTLRLVNGAAARAPAAPAFIGEKLGQQLSDANRAFNGFVVNAVKKNAEQTVKLMDLVADRATKNIDALAAAAERVQNERAAPLVKAWNNAQLPMAQISLRIADAIASGAEKLEARVAGAAESSGAATTVHVKSPRARAAGRKA